jgi:hypothetical protein
MSVGDTQIAKELSQALAGKLGETRLRDVAEAVAAL